MSSPSACDCGAQEVKRDDSSDVVFSTEEAKWKAVLTEIRHMHRTGRPVLVRPQHLSGAAGRLRLAVQLRPRAPGRPAQGAAAPPRMGGRGPAAGTSRSLPPDSLARQGAAPRTQPQRSRTMVEWSAPDARAQVGTTSVERSEYLAGLLGEADIKYQVRPYRSAVPPLIAGGVGMWQAAASAGRHAALWAVLALLLCCRHASRVFAGSPGTSAATGF